MQKKNFLLLEKMVLKHSHQSKTKDASNKSNIFSSKRLISSTKNSIFFKVSKFTRYESDFCANKKLFDKNYKSGAKNIPNNKEKPKEIDCFNLFFTPLLNHVLSLINDNLKKNSASTRRNSKYYLVLNESLLRSFICVYLSLGLVNYNSYYSAFQNPKNTNGLLGNTFVRNEISFSKFQLINEYLNFDINTVLNLFNNTSKKYWNLTENVCIDDQLYLYEGRTKERVHLEKKADQTGILFWEIVDEKKYTYHMEPVSSLKIKYGIRNSRSAPKKSISQFFSEELINQLPNQPYCVVIDAGTLGSFETAKYLSEKNFKFIVSTSKNRPSWLWERNQKDIKLYDTKIYYKRDMMAISYFVRKLNSSKKIVNYFSNLPHVDKKISIRTWNKKEKVFKDVHCPLVLEKYRKIHGFVDQRKQIEASIRNKHRCKTSWRSKFNNFIYVLLVNCFVWYKDVNNINSKTNPKYNLFVFTKNLILQLSKKLPNIDKGIPKTPSLESSVVKYHKLKNYGKSGYCAICGNHIRKQCLSCPEKPFLCEGECGIRFHNPKIQIVE
jgi:hypothetical protein